MKRARSDAIDIGRAFSLLAMTLYHFTWDLSYFQFISPSAPFTLPMRFASHAIGSSFLVLVGVSLALAHDEGVNWRSFFLRLAKIAAAAALVTGGSAVFAPDFTIWFGILHCIFGASLVCALFLRAPVGVAALVGLTAIAAGILVSNPAFNSAGLVWLGVGTQTPWTLDWRPLLPWGGIVWLGFDGARFWRGRFPAQADWTWRAVHPVPRSLAWLGRHSLAYYLLHQLALFGLLFPLAWAYSA